MSQIGRLFAVIAGVLLVVGAAVFLLFQSSMFSGDVRREATTDSLDAVIAEIEAGRATTPLVFQPSAGLDATVTFLVQSTEGLTPRIVSDVTGWGESPNDSDFDQTIGTMTRLGSTDWFHLETRVAPRARIEYLTVHGKTDYRVDPNNPRRSWSHAGHDRSEFVTPDYRPPQEFVDPPVTPGGMTVEDVIDSDALGAPRRALVYVPPGYRNDGAYPVAVFHSGWGIARNGQAVRVLDWLIANRKIEPMVGLFLESYLAGDDDNHEGPPLRVFLSEEGPAWLASRYSVSPSADDWAVLAISYGAKDALDASLAPAQIYGRLGLLIPGRRLKRTDLEAYGRQPGRRLHVAILVGRYDYANLATAQLAHQTLTDAGHRVDSIEVPEGHNSTTRRDHLSDVLISLFGPRPG
jgi:enterochelin esterase-like enzyme